MPDALIAIIDDDERVRTGVSRLLSLAGYRCVGFESGIVFLNYELKHEIRCMILDMDMPGLNGVDLLSRFAEMNYTVPTIIVTRHERELREVALQLGAFAVLPKTSSGEALIKAVESAVGSTR